jgi:hypothetical protein
LAATGQGIDTQVADRLLLHPQLVLLPSLGLGYHLGDQISAQPHLSGLTLTAAWASLGWTGRVVHKWPAHAFADLERFLPGWPR